tara:strand:+ start:3896 stop:4987 length:1092 start_codon:yes stop_codon:yes gene_type:complete
MIKVGSDFSGVGSFNQALKRLGIKYDEVFACDMDKHARETFILNYGEPKYFPKDVYDREIPKDPLTLYVTSPPCQAFSIAGKKLGKNDKRGILFFNSYEFIKKNKPRFFIFENVKGLLSDDNGNTFKEWLNYLGAKSVNGLPIIFPYEKSLPYHLYHKVINCKNLGIPQNRERVFIVGIRDDIDNNFTFPKNEHLIKRLKDVLEKEVDPKHNLSEKMLEKITFEGKKTGEVANLNKGGERGSVYSIDCAYMSCLTATDYKQPKQIMLTQLNKSKESFGKQPYQQNRVYDVNGVNPALNSGQESWGGNIINTQQIRRLTPRECFRLMDFPDSFTWICSDSQAYKQAGNSIVVKCLEKIIEKLIK